MKKLEIKHLAAYLPYELKFFWKTKPKKLWELAMLGDSKKSFPGIHVLITQGEESQQVIIGVKSKLIKPLLIPLSEFNDSEADKEIFEYQGAYTSVKLNAINELPYWQFEILVKHHFDVFGLLESGLALNKLTCLQDENGR